MKQRSRIVKVLSYFFRSLVCFLQWCLNILIILIATNQHVQFIGGRYIDYSNTADFFVMIVLILIIVFMNWGIQIELSVTGEENG